MTHASHNPAGSPDLADASYNRMWDLGFSRGLGACRSVELLCESMQKAHLNTDPPHPGTLYHTLPYKVSKPYSSTVLRTQPVRCCGESAARS